MDNLQIASLMILALFISVVAGIHIAFSLAAMSVLGIILMSGNLNTGVFILATTSFEALRSYTFAVIPLFMLMGSFMSNSDIAKNMFKVTNIILKKLPGGLGVATVAANAVFAAVTGVSIASAAIFSKVAVPQMIHHKYNGPFAAGSVAGSSVLGMLIPPSLLLIVYGMLAEVSIGRMFIAGIVPGVLLALFFAIGIILMAIFRPAWVYVKGYDSKKVQQIVNDEKSDTNFLKLALSVLPVILLIILVLGGIWGGFFTPTEASAFGALGALVIGFPLGMGIRGFKKSLLDTAAGTSSILFLLITATMYSRMLTMSGLLNWASRTVMNLDASPYAILFIFIGIILIMGCVLDSTSILIVTVPIMAPIMSLLGFDLIWFGIVLVLAVHMGLLTPPFGMCVFAVKSSIDIPITVEKIFWGAMPFLIMMVPHLLLVILFPVLATWLPSLM